jgi:flagellin
VLGSAHPTAATIHGMSSIATNPIAMQAVRTLAATLRAIAGTQARIESGLSVPTADVAPARFAIAQGMRAELAGWAAVRSSLGLGGALVITAADAARAISDTVATAKAKYLQRIGLPGEADRAILRREIEGLVARIDAMARSAVFNGVNLLVVPDIPGPPPVQPPGFAALIGAASGSGSQTFVVDAGPIAAPVVLELDLLPLNDVVEIWQGPVRVAATGRPPASGGAPVDPGLPVNGLQTLTFDYDPGNGTTLELRFNPEGGGSGWVILDFRLDLPEPPPQPPPEPPRFAILRHPSGAAISVAYRDMTASGLGLDGLDFDDPAIGLAQLDAAVRRAAADAGHFGQALRTVEGAKAAERAFADSLREGLGALVDADLGAEAARLAALQVRAELARQSLGIANAAPEALLALFRR